MEPSSHDEPHLPGPSLWPIGFAVGLVAVLVGLIVSWPAVAVGSAIAVFCGFMWIRDATRGYQAPVAPPEPHRPAAPAGLAPRAEAGGAALPVMSDAELERFPRSRFLEATTLGLGAVIGGIVTVPALGFMVAPAFVDQGEKDVDLGPLENFPEGQFVIATFYRDPEQGEVTRRTAYVRNNGAVRGAPSFTILSNRCVHLGCPVQPGGPVADEEAKQVRAGRRDEVTIIPTQPANFSCPCHGGSYDTEGNRIAGPPVRALDRYDFAIRNGNLILKSTYSVAYVEENTTGATAKIHRHRVADPGVHIDGLEQWFYPILPPR